MADLPERAEKAAEGSDTDGSSSLALPVAVTQASFLSNYPKGVSGVRQKREPLFYSEGTTWNVSMSPMNIICSVAGQIAFQSKNNQQTETQTAKTKAFFSIHKKIT